MNLDELTTADDRGASDEPFRLANDRLLHVALDGTVTTKAGAMVAYSGDVTFSGKRSAEGGITGFLKDAATSEGTPVMEAEGSGHLYLADAGKQIQVLDLEAGESLSVNGDDVLAFDEDVTYEIGTIDSLAASSTGGLTNVFLEGPGRVAITTHGDPLALSPPVTTDPAATVAWSGVSPSMEINRSLSDLIGSSSGETYQLEFTGSEGVVIVQPFEETTP